MKAFSILEPGRTEFIEVAEPVPGPGEVLLQPRMIGMCGTDLSTFRGKNPLVTYPRIPGHEIAATVVTVGLDVPDVFRPGTYVAVYPTSSCDKCASCKRGRTNACKYNETLGVQRDGAMKSYFTAPWRKLVVSEGLAARELSLVEPLAVGFHAVARGRVTQADVVGVIGCGMVGLGAIAGATQRGARVIAIDLDDQKLQLAKEAGAQHAVNSRAQDVTGDIGALTGADGPDVVIEAVGTPATYRMAVEQVAHTGRVVYIGWANEPVCYETKHFVHKELDILGSRNSFDEFPEVIAMLRDRKFPVEQSISATVPFAEAGSALSHWSASPLSYTKILIDMEA
jgi:threonine dehydrogenase-like Zn-dependent dehydrogenase